MKIVYIAGKFRGPTAWDIAENVRVAERTGLEAANLGAMPLIPHSNTAHFHGQCTEQFWVDGTLALLRKADAVLCCHNWKESTGARGEVAEAQRIGIPVFTLVAQLRAWLDVNP